MDVWAKSMGSERFRWVLFYAIHLPGKHTSIFAKVSFLLVSLGKNRWVSGLDGYAWVCPFTGTTHQLLIPKRPAMRSSLPAARELGTVR